MVRRLLASDAFAIHGSRVGGRAQGSSPEPAACDDVPEDASGLRSRTNRLLASSPAVVDVRNPADSWEQGRARPNAQAALLINLVKRYPDTVERLAAL
jgi:putative transcriptional regulator